MLARISRWLAAPVRVDPKPQAGSGFGGRSFSVVPNPPDEPEPPPRREPIRFSEPVVQHPAADRQRTRETEYDQLQTEIARLADPNSLRNDA